MRIGTTSTVRTVLVVDDEPILRMNAADTLEEVGCNVIEASNADEALDIMESGLHVDLLVTDIQMPGTMSGIRLSVTVNDRWPGTEILITSGRVRPRSHELPRNVRFLAKPYPAWKLADAVMRLAG